MVRGRNREVKEEIKMVMTKDRLKEIFPEHAEEIDKIERSTACGCSGCIWMILKGKYPDLTIPEDYYGIWV